MKTAAGLLLAVLAILVFQLTRKQSVNSPESDVLIKESARQSPSPIFGRDLPGRIQGRSEPAKVFDSIFTNGILSLSKLETEPEYNERVRKHVQLRAIINSPVRDTEECLRIADIVVKNNYGIDILPTAYSYSWQHGDFLRRFPNGPDNSTNAERMFRIGMLDTDFKTYLERTSGRVSQGFIDELLTAIPSRDFGRINTIVVENEPFYEEASGR